MNKATGVSDEEEFVKGQSSRDLRDRSDAKGDLAQIRLGRAGDLKIMNMVILIDSVQMFFRNFRVRHVNAALGHFAHRASWSKCRSENHSAIRETC